MSNKLRMNPMKLATVALAVAGYEVERAGVSPGVLHDYFFDSAEDESDDDDDDIIMNYIMMFRDLMSYSWHHPTPVTFLSTMLTYTQETEHSTELFKLASYLCDLVTVYGPHHVPPSVIATGALTAARQTLDMAETGDQVSCLRSSDQVSGGNMSECYIITYYLVLV